MASRRVLSYVLASKISGFKKYRTELQKDGKNRMIHKRVKSGNCDTQLDA